jgi:small-conductance mechanosensitive channel
MNFNWYIAAVICYIVICLIQDFILRSKKVDVIGVRIYETIAISMLLVFLLLTTNNTGLIAIIGTGIVSFAWIFKDILENLGSTLLMHLYPQYSDDDILSVGHGINILPNVKFQGLGFLRSKLIDEDGTIMYVPNSNLMSDFVRVEKL